MENLMDDMDFSPFGFSPSASRQSLQPVNKSKAYYWNVGSIYEKWSVNHSSRVGAYPEPRSPHETGPPLCRGSRNEIL